MQRRLRQGPTEPVLNANGACFEVQSRLRCCMAEASLECNGASIANRKNGHFSTILIIRQLENASESRICDRRNSWWIILKSGG